MPDPEPTLPRPPEDPDRLRRLREDALRRVEEEERRYPITVYGGPPIGGGNGGSPVTRRWTLRGLLLALIALLAGLGALFFGRKYFQAPVYGGPPAPQPDRPNPPAAVYGGPVPPPDSKETPSRPSPNPPAPNPPAKKRPKPPPAPVYGGAPPLPPG